MINKKVCLIANNNLGKDVFDGQRIKVREYIKIFDYEGIIYRIVDLELFKSKPFTMFKKLKECIKECDVSVFISASRGVRFLLPIVSFLCEKYKKRLVLPLVGSSVLNYHLKKLKERQIKDFFSSKNNDVCKDKILVEKLRKVNLIMPETDILSNVFSSYYGLNNVKTFPNIRLTNPVCNLEKNGKYVFLSRINFNKGIFDLIDSVNEINESADKKIYLDIYGTFQLSKKERCTFDMLLKNNSCISYCGSVNPSEVIKTLSNYDYLVFPTKFISEGIPGVIIESLIAGTPVISSNYPQVSSLLKNGVNSIIFEMGDKDKLKEALLLSKSNEIKSRLFRGAVNSADTYLYKNQKKNFYDCIFGKLD